MDHRPERAKVLASQGLLWRKADGSGLVKVPVSRSASDVSRADLVPGLCQAYSTRKAVQPFVPHLRTEARVLTLQNVRGQPGNPV